MASSALAFDAQASIRILIIEVRGIRWLISYLRNFERSKRG